MRFGLRLIHSAFKHGDAKVFAFAIKLCLESVAMAAEAGGFARWQAERGRVMIPGSPGTTCRYYPGWPALLSERVPGFSVPEMCQVMRF
jgi:hypothetical protein